MRHTGRLSVSANLHLGASKLLAALSVPLSLSNLSHLVRQLSFISSRSLLAHLGADSRDSAVHWAISL